jgi:hypothetical protein
MAAAISLNDLCSLPSNYLDALKDDRAGNSASASTSNGRFASSGQSARRQDRGDPNDDAEFHVPLPFCCPAR